MGTTNKEYSKLAMIFSLLELSYHKTIDRLLQYRNVSSKGSTNRFRGIKTNSGLSKNLESSHFGNFSPIKKVK